MKRDGGRAALAFRAGLIASATLFSRLLGLVRDMCMAWLLGGSGAADALTLALRLPNMARRLLGEGVLSMSLTASISRTLPSMNTPPDAMLPARLSRLATARAAPLAAILGGAVLFGEALAEPLLTLLAPGRQAEFTSQSAFLLRICLPYVLFAGISALFMALLHSLRSFFLPSLSAAFFNLTVIAFAGLAALDIAEPAFLLATGVLCGGIVQCAGQGMALCKFGLRPQNVRSGGMDEAKRESRRHILSIAGAAAPQISMFGAAMLASWLPAGSMAALYYAERILEFPLGLAGSALGMASLPDLAALSAAGCAEDMNNRAGEALELSFCLSLPAAAGLLATAEILTNVLFLRGAFDSEAIAAAAALRAYAPALPAYAAGRPLLALCNACGNTRLAGTSALVSVPLAFIVGLALLQHGTAGPALGVSLGLWAQTAALWIGLRRNAISPRIHPSALARYVMGAFLVFAATYSATLLLPVSFLSLMLIIILGMATYALFLLPFRRRGSLPRLRRS